MFIKVILSDFYAYMQSDMLKIFWNLSQLAKGFWLFCKGFWLLLGFPSGSEVKASAWNVGDMGLIPGSDPWVRKILWRRKWQPTPVFLPGESHGWRSLVGYSPRGRKELDTTERLNFQLWYMFIHQMFVQLFHHGNR